MLRRVHPSSVDADFTLVLIIFARDHRRTVVYANEKIADIYKAFSDAGSRSAK